MRRVESGPIGVVRAPIRTNAFGLRRTIARRPGDIHRRRLGRVEASSQQPTALVVGVVLAAGAAERMGNAKQLLPYKGAILLQHAVDAAEASRLDGVIVVTGAYADEVEAALRVDRAVTVRNPDFRRGNMSSLEVGAARRSAGRRGDASDG